MLWYSIPKGWVHTISNQQVKKSVYNWILQHPQVVVSPIANDCVKLFIDVQVEPQLVTKLLLKVLVRELNNITVSPTEEDVINDAIYTDNNIIISDSSLRKNLPYELKNVYSQYKFTCDCE